MEFRPPTQQTQYADLGRRDITILGRTVTASRVRLKEADARLLGGTHEIFIDRFSGSQPQQFIGQTVTFDGTPYRIVKAMDPLAADQKMRGRYIRLIVTEPPTEA